MEDIFLDIKENLNPPNFQKPRKDKHTADKSGNSFVKFALMKFTNGTINIECYDWSIIFEPV